MENKIQQREGFAVREDELRNELRRLEENFSSSTPAKLPKNYIAEIELNTPYIPGTTSQAINVTWRARPSGILVPAFSDKPHAPIDLVSVYLTPGEILGIIPPPGYIVDQLSRISIIDIINFTARIMADIRTPSLSRRSIDQKYANLWFSEPTRSRVKNLLLDSSRSLVTPQALFVLMKYAMRHSGECVLPAYPSGNVVSTLLTIHQYLNTDSEEELNSSGNSPGSLGRELIANQIFNNSPSEVGVIGSFHRCWKEIPKENLENPRIVDLEATYRETVGIDLDDLGLVAIGLWSSTINGNPIIQSSYYSSLQWSPDRLRNIFNLISLPLAEVRQKVKEEVHTRGHRWAISTFEQWPVIEIDEDVFAVIDAHLLLNRVFGRLPVFDIIDALTEEDSKESKKLIGKIRSCIGQVYENYAIEVLESIVPNSDRFRRLYDDSALKSSFSGKSKQIADAVIDYGDAWVVIEITTVVMRRDSVAGISDEAVQGDIEKLVDEAKQIAATINHLRENESKLTGRAGRQGKEYYPLIVTAGGFPVNPITLTLLRQKVEDAGILQEFDTHPIEIAEIEDLEIIEGLNEIHPTSIKDLLAAKSKSGMSLAGIRNYILNELNYHVQRPSRLEPLIQKAFSGPLKRFVEVGD